MEISSNEYFVKLNLGEMLPVFFRISLGKCPLLASDGRNLFFYMELGISDFSDDDGAIAFFLDDHGFIHICSFFFEMLCEYSHLPHFFVCA